MRRIMDRRSRTYRPRERDYRERDYRERMSDRDKRRDYGQYEPYEEDYASRRRGRRDGNYGNYDRYDTHYDKEYDDYDYGYDRDYSDGEDDMRLTKRDITEWKSSMMNADGSRGEHFRGETVERVARDMGISFKDFDEKTLCLTTNILFYILHAPVLSWEHSLSNGFVLLLFWHIQQNSTFWNGGQH